MYYQEFLKVGLVVPKVEIGKPLVNVQEILRVVNQEKKAEVMLFPELSISGYSIGDLVYHQQFQKENLDAIAYLLKNNHYHGVIICGAPLSIRGQLYNCALVIQKNKILGIIPKLYFPETREFIESRYFSSGKNLIPNVLTVNLYGEEVPIGNLIFINNQYDVAFAVEVCADLWSIRNLNENYYLNGAQIVFNLSASSVNVGKGKHRRTLTENASLKGSGAYVYVSSGVTESSSNVLFSGHALVSTCGDTSLDEQNFNFETVVYYDDLDIEKIRYNRNVNCYLRNNVLQSYREIAWELNVTKDYQFEKPVDKEPFIPKDPKDLELISKVQIASVYKRLLHVNTQKAIVGVSGGLDSTLALLSLVKMCDTYGIDRKNVLGVTMPALATTSESKSRAMRLMEKLCVTLLEISIKDEVNDNLHLIKHDGKTKDITYENAQARYRTMLLLNLANKENGLVIGTSDMSEIALGWSTFGGDQFAMYGINAGIPKTLVRRMVAYYQDVYPEVKDILAEVIDAPITPELTDQNQKTEAVIGNYEINDFILYQYLNCGASFSKIKFLLGIAFGLSEEECQKYIENFDKRFKKNQYKRLSSPESVKILSISLNNTDYRLPGDIK